MPAMAPRFPYSFAGPLLPLRRHFAAHWRHDFTAPPSGRGVAVARRIAARRQHRPVPRRHPCRLLEHGGAVWRRHCRHHAASHRAAPAAARRSAVPHGELRRRPPPPAPHPPAPMRQAIAQHPQRLGDPLSLTVNFAGALVAGPFTVQAQPVRTNRSTQHWTLAILQAGADGVQQLTTSATAVTALRRETWSVGDVPMPQVPAPAGQPAIPSGFGVEWLNRYEIRLITGAIPRTWDGTGEHSLTQLWVRDAPPRALDFC